MADKRIIDFTILNDAQDDDLLLIASDETTYAIKVKAIKDAVEGMAQRAEAAALKSQGLIEEAVSAGKEAKEQASAADAAAERANQKAQEAATATEQANTAAANANEKATAADEAAQKVGTAVRKAEEAAVKAENAAGDAQNHAEKAKSAAEDALAEGAYAKQQGDVAAAMLEAIQKMEAGEVAQELANLKQTVGKLFYVGPDQPAKGPILWLNTAGREEIAGERIVILNLGEPSGDADVYLELENGEQYPVENATGTLNGDIYEVTVENE